MSAIDDGRRIASCGQRSGEKREGASVASMQPDDAVRMKAVPPSVTTSASSPSEYSTEETWRDHACDDGSSHANADRGSGSAHDAVAAALATWDVNSSR